MTKAVTLADIKNDVYSFIAAGGNIYARPRTSIPYYERMNNYAKSQTRRGTPTTIDDVYLAIGIFYDENYDGLFRELAQIADEDGYIDDFRRDERLRSKIHNAAKLMGLRQDEWIATMTPYKLKEARVSVGDYALKLKRELAEFRRKNGSLNTLRINDPELYNKLRHFRTYAPLGSFGSLSDAAAYLGEKYETDKDVSLTINVSSLVKELNKQYPTKVIDKLDVPTYKKALQYSLFYDQTMSEFLAHYGFSYSEKNHKTRLEVMKLTDNEKQVELKEICSAIAAKSGFVYDFDKFDNLSAVEKTKILETQKAIAVLAVEIYNQKINQEEAQA